MLAARYALLAAALAGQLPAAGGIPAEEYRARRAALRAVLADGVTALAGRAAGEAGEIRSGFIQEPNFLYLTGWREPGAMLLLIPPSGEVLFLPERDPARERYSGRRASAGDADIRTATGFDQVLPAGEFASRLGRALEARSRIYTLAGSPMAGTLKALLPQHEPADAAREIGRLRLRKSPGEVALIRKSVEATAEAHRAAWNRIRPGRFEYQVAAAMVGSYLGAGCERSAYAPIVASGPNASILHYNANRRRMEAGELVLVDAGAECSGYAADLTRTLPVAGRFTPRQRRLYEAVLGAQKAVIEAVRPGASFDRDAPGSLTRVAQEHLDAHGKDSQGRPLGRHLTHLVGHHVGLDVHDAGALSTSGPLQAGMVITVECGIYMEEEGIGIRIEDMLLVTPAGAELLSGSLPKEVSALEKALSR